MSAIDVAESASWVGRDRCWLTAGVTAPLTRRQRNDADPGGLIVVDKPSGISSHDVVARVRRIVGSRKVGHGGTLDPMATGVLIVAVNRSTRLLAHLQLNTKVYEATIRLGQSTTTDDAEGEPTAGASPQAISEADVRAGVAALTGDIEQVPSAVSAIKVDGERAYKLVRAGNEVKLAPRPVTVSRFDVVAFTRPTDAVLDLEVTVECSSGTYVRALARDLGNGLGVGGHLTALRRTQVGPFGLDRARSLEELADLKDPIGLTLADAIRVAFAVRDISVAEADALSYGQFLEPWGFEGTYGVIDSTGRAVALMHDERDRGRPQLVFIGRG
jgi:tRNA pseudouridine55 synthase